MHTNTQPKVDAAASTMAERSAAVTALESFGGAPVAVAVGDCVRVEIDLRQALVTFRLNGRLVGSVEIPAMAQLRRERARLREGEERLAEISRQIQEGEQAMFEGAFRRRAQVVDLRRLHADERAQCAARRKAVVQMARALEVD